MGFFVAFMLLVLPLFLIVCIRMIRNSEFGKTGFGKFLEVIFALFALAAIVTAVYLFTLI